MGRVRVLTGTRSTKINAQQMQLAEASRDVDITATITGSTIQSLLARRNSLRRNTPQLKTEQNSVRTKDSEAKPQFTSTNSHTYRPTSDTRSRVLQSPNQLAHHTWTSAYAQNSYESGHAPMHAKQHPGGQDYKGRQQHDDIAYLEQAGTHRQTKSTNRDSARAHSTRAWPR